MFARPDCSDLGKFTQAFGSIIPGFRGGFIFPLMLAGAAFGRVVYAIYPSMPLPVAVLSFSAGMNTAITRTSLATTIILGFLSGESQLFASCNFHWAWTTRLTRFDFLHPPAGEPCATPSILSASLCSLFATAYVGSFCRFHTLIVNN